MPTASDEESGICPRFVGTPACARVVVRPGRAYRGRSGDPRARDFPGTQCRSGVVSLRCDYELGKVEFMAGNLADAAENMRAAYALIETAEDQVTKPAIAAELACVLALEGHVQEAEELALAARAMSTGGFFAETCWRRALALVAAHESRFEEAIRLSEEATARANASDSLTFRGQTLEEAATVRRFAGTRCVRRKP